MENIDPTNFTSLYENSDYLDPNIDVDSLSLIELRDLYVNHWKGSSGLFAKIYSLNRNNFSKWLNGNFKACLRCPNIIKIYLKRIQNLDSYRPISISNITLSSLLNRIQFLSNFNLKLLVFVDADNTHIDFEFIESIVGDNIKYIHVIAFVNKYSPPKSLYTLENKSYFSLLLTDTSEKNAADTKLSVAVSVISSTLNIPITFIVAFHDNFANELIENMRELYSHKYIRSDKDLDYILDLEIRTIY